MLLRPRRIRGYVVKLDRLEPLPSHQSFWTRKTQRNYQVRCSLSLFFRTRVWGTLAAVALDVCLTPAALPLGRRFAAEQLCELRCIYIDAIDEPSLYNRAWLDLESPHHRSVIDWNVYYSNRGIALGMLPSDIAILQCHRGPVVTEQRSCDFDYPMTLT